MSLLRKNQKRKKKRGDTGSNWKIKKNNPLNLLKLTPLTFEGRGREIIEESQSKGVTPMLPLGVDTILY